MSHNSSRDSKTHDERPQRGVVLLIALIVLAAMSLASVALIRSVDTAGSIVGNVGFSQAALSPANLAVEEVVSVMFEKNLIKNTNVDQPDQNYYAAIQGGEDKRGVPEVLTTRAKSLALARRWDAGNGNDVTWVIERTCAQGIPVDPTDDQRIQFCDMLPPKPSGTTTMETTKIKLPEMPMYRLTVRVDGPRNAVALMRTMLR